jgi:N4-gp56 family major capsid protein
MATIGGQTANIATQFSGDIVNYIAEKTLPLARRQLVAYQFGDPLTLPKGRGTTYTATRYMRLPLPLAPISEGVPPIGETMTIQQVSAVAQQWGDKVTITDVAEMTIYHPLFQKATELVGLQVAETLERNTFQTLLSGTQYNFVNSRASRAALVAGDVISPFEVQRSYALLFNQGAPRFSGDEQTDTKLDADAGGAKASNNPRQMPHFTAIIHPFVAADLRQNPAVQTAWSYSDINRLYNYEAGEFNGIRFCESNMVPSFTGFTATANGATYTAGTAGSLASATYFLQITGTDLNNNFESQIYAISAGQAVTGPNGSVSVVVPNIAGFTYNVYISTSATMAGAKLGGVTAASPAQGPTTGAYQGMAVGIPAGATVVIGSVGATPWQAAQNVTAATATPPAAPASTITVYPTFIIGRGAYGQVKLDDVKFTYLREADKSDPLNQLRVVGWKCFYGTLIENQNFFMRLESVSQFGPSFDHPSGIQNF